MNSVIRSRAPLRLGLAGGGTDVSPYCDLYGGSVLNASIDKFAYTFISKRNDDKIFFKASDLNSSKLMSSGLINDVDRSLIIHSKVYQYMIKNYHKNINIPLNITTYCDVMPGSGLGSSSTVIVSMIKAFVELLDLGLDVFEIAKIAYKIERVECNISGGKQDQYAAAFGGFNLMEFFKDDDVKITPLKIKNWIICELEASTLLYFTGVSRESSNIIEDQISSYKNNQIEVINAMHSMKKQTYFFKEALIRGDLNDLIKSINLSWENKKKSSTKISNSRIDLIYKSAMEEGALAGKVSGAGGGGFMWFIVPPEKKLDVSRALESFGGEVANCHFINKGCEAWRI